MSLEIPAFEVAPHGGRLVDRVLRGDRLAEAHERVPTLTRLSLNARMMSPSALTARSKGSWVRSITVAC